MHVHLLRTQAPRAKGPPKKLLRSLAGLGGVSDSTLAKQLAWIREHPEVLCATCIKQCSDEAMKRSGDHRLHHLFPSLSVHSCFVKQIRCLTVLWAGAGLGKQRSRIPRLGVSALSWQMARPMISFPSPCLMQSVISAGSLPTSCGPCATWLRSAVRGFMHTHAHAL